MPVTKHGMARRRGSVPEYSVWVSLRSRCNNKNDPHYPRYGGRGIKVSQDWSSFERFYADMGQRPHPKAQIDRKDNNGPYCASNCHWTTHRANSNNRRSSVLLEFNGVTKSCSEWARAYQLPVYLVANRVRHGWTIENAITTPKRRVTK